MLLGRCFRQVSSPHYAAIVQPDKRGKKSLMNEDRSSCSHYVNYMINVKLMTGRLLEAVCAVIASDAIYGGHLITCVYLM